MNGSNSIALCLCSVGQSFATTSNPLTCLHLGLEHAAACVQLQSGLLHDADAPVSSSRIRVAAATALGAAAVKAKMLADAEEREVQRQVQAAIDAQIQKVQLKLNSMTQLEDALEKERSIMEVCDAAAFKLTRVDMF